MIKLIKYKHFSKENKKRIINFIKNHPKLNYSKIGKHFNLEGSRINYIALKYTNIRRPKPKLKTSVCLYCKNPFSYPNWKIYKDRKYCSHECFLKSGNAHKVKKITKKCEGCKNKYVILPCYSSRKYCSHECFLKHLKIWNKGLTKYNDIRLENSGIKVRKWALMHKNPTLFKKNDPNHPMKNLKIKRKALKSLFKRPTKLEQKFILFFNKYSLPFNYCGDGSFFIGGLCPDFVNKKKKFCMEVGNMRFKTRIAKINPKNYEQQRILHFAKYGWKCFVIWEEDFNEGELVEKIRGNI